MQVTTSLMEGDSKCMELETRFFKDVENLLGGCDEYFVAKFFPTEQKKFLN